MSNNNSGQKAKPRKIYFNITGFEKISVFRVPFVIRKIEKAEIQSKGAQLIAIEKGFKKSVEGLLNITAWQNLPVERQSKNVKK